MATLVACAGTTLMSTRNLTPPVAAQKPHLVTSPSGDRQDPYYWLRDDSRANPEMLAYLAAENAYKDAMLAPLRGLQDQLYNEILARIKQDDASPPTLSHGYWYYTRYETGREYPLYCRRKGTMQAPEEVMLDGNALAAGKGYHKVGGYAVSQDDKLLAYTEDTVGRRQYVLRIKDLATGKVYPDAVANVDPDIVWADDNRTILYVAKDPETLLGERVKRHVLGTPATKDTLVYEEKDHSFYMGVSRSKTDRFLFIGLQSTLVSEWLYAEANDPRLKFKPVLPREASHEYQVEHVGDDFIIRTNWLATNFRLVRAPVKASADKKTWRDIVPHAPDVLVEGFDVFRDYLAINERSGGLRKIRIKPWVGGTEFYLKADEPAYTETLDATPEFDSQVVRYVYGSLTTPSTTYDYDMRTGAKTLVKREPVLGDFDPVNYVTEFVHATARDGTKIPISLVHRKGLKLDGTAPLLQYGYGSYGLSMNPSFRSSRLSLLDRGFVYAIAHIRGGQEMGRAWYDDGKLLKKANTFNDFIDAGEFLVKAGYAHKDKLFASGGSAGGLLMGAVVNARPDLYRAIVTQVPFVDVVTTMLDESIPLTTNEFDEWGNPKQKAFYDYMLSYSPYDNVKAMAYPAMLVETGLWDSQVQYYEPAKWVARLRATKTDANSLLFHINMEAGHGGKSGRFQQYRDVAMEYAFLLDQAGLAR
ncbi:MAG TPA: S9 family peptidase [Verrucomicrobiae bacterium]|nr:S9 family peptidase [Verrucomicrobiae bacterium]